MSSHMQGKSCNCGLACMDSLPMEDGLPMTEQELLQQLEEIQAKWDEVLDQNKEVRITVAKKDIFVDAFGICWTPYYTNSYGKLVKAF